MKSLSFRFMMLLALSLLPGFGAIAVPPVASGNEVTVVTTIQAAVNEANPGDIIIVPPGTYDECVLVDKNDITIRGSRAAVINAAKCDNGMRVGTGEITPGPPGYPVCPPASVRNFSIEGLTVENARGNGIFLIGVDGFHVAHGEYRNNAQYGPYARCSMNGLIDFNHAEGSNDAVIYVGNSDTVVVANNHAEGNTIGIEIENSLNCIVQDNETRANTTGILVVVLPGLPIPRADNVLIQRNVVVRNNMPNPVPFGSGDVVGLLPAGTGILNVGGDRVTVRDNVVMQNNSLGIAIFQNQFAPQDPRIDPFPDGNEVRNNTILRNGKNPDAVRDEFPGVDILFVTSGGTGNCFEHNIFKTEYPAGITGFFPCP
jgi:parallel beta-helix repeat protein